MAAIAAVVLLVVAAMVILSGGPEAGTPATEASPGTSLTTGPGDPTAPPGPTPSPSPRASPSTRSPSPSPSKSTSGPTVGLRAYQDSYKVQRPYDLSVSERFAVSAGPVYTAWILRGDKPFEPGSGTGPRTEMRWGNWSRVEHMWEADVLIDEGSEGTAIMQVKSNDGYEPVYVNVKNHGSLYNDSDRTVLATDVWGVWLHLVCGYDPVSGDGRVWVNGRLALTRHDPHPLDTVWYFKNGVYGITGAKSQAHFKNVRFWTR